MYTERTPRIVAARKLTKRTGRDNAGRFLAEGAQAVREALAWSGNSRGQVHELFLTEAAQIRHGALIDQAATMGVPISLVTERAAAELSETVSPQGIIALCDLVDQPIDRAIPETPRLVVMLVGVSDPGNAGTVVRVADAAGADAVLFVGDTVDPHNGKCVRSSTGSLFHLPIARSRDAAYAIDTCRSVGLRVVAADGYAQQDLDTAITSGNLAKPTAWLFGNEAHGLPDDVLAAADETLAVPIYGSAESLNLATAAAVCLYATARAQRSANA